MPEFIHGQAFDPEDQALTLKDDCDYWMLIRKLYVVSMYYIYCSIHIHIDENRNKCNFF